MSKENLTAEKWLLAGIDALVQQGPQALKAEPLARALSTTKGSFYWHFKDVPDFHQKMTMLWASQAVTSFTQSIEGQATVPMRLRQLGQAPAIITPLNNSALETAFRAWAHSNNTVAYVIADIDTRRIAHLVELLIQLGITDPSFSTLIYGAWIGLHTQDNADTTQAMETLIDLILALR